MMFARRASITQVFCGIVEHFDSASMPDRQHLPEWQEGYAGGHRRVRVSLNRKRNVEVDATDSRGAHEIATTDTA